jgi:hypothetical protein
VERCATSLHPSVFLELDKFGVPQPEQGELKAIVESTQEAIVVTPLQEENWSRRLSRSDGSRSACFGRCRRRQAVLAPGLDQLPGDGEPHQGADDILFRVAVSKGSDDGAPGTGETVV